LTSILHAVFPEAAIFRIDHYLGKEAVENLLFFRFANTFLEPIWNRNYVHSAGHDGGNFWSRRKGQFYDRTGAIRDVVQNHLLQVVAFLAMEPQVKVFRMIPPLDPAHLVRGQFRGYRDESGVAPDSQVETFAAVSLEVDSWRWAGVPFLIRAGKCLPVTATEVLVKLRQFPLSKLDAESFEPRLANSAFNCASRGRSLEIVPWESLALLRQPGSIMQWQAFAVEAKCSERQKQCLNCLSRSRGQPHQ
jgi:glucose-6-phosphate 1-dehydrogenase